MELNNNEESDIGMSLVKISSIITGKTLYIAYPEEIYGLKNNDEELDKLEKYLMFSEDGINFIKNYKYSDSKLKCLIDKKICQILSIMEYEYTSLTSYNFEFL